MTQYGSSQMTFSKQNVIAAIKYGRFETSQPHEISKTGQYQLGH